MGVELTDFLTKKIDQITKKKYKKWPTYSSETSHGNALNKTSVTCSLNTPKSTVSKLFSTEKPVDHEDLDFWNSRILPMLIWLLVEWMGLIFRDDSLGLIRLNLGIRIKEKRRE